MQEIELTEFEREDDAFSPDDRLQMFSAIYTDGTITLTTDEWEVLGRPEIITAKIQAVQSE